MKHGDCGECCDGLRTTQAAGGPGSLAPLFPVRLGSGPGKGPPGGGSVLHTHQGAADDRLRFGCLCWRPSPGLTLSVCSPPRQEGPGRCGQRPLSGSRSHLRERPRHLRGAANRAPQARGWVRASPGVLTGWRCAVPQGRRERRQGKGPLLAVGAEARGAGGQALSPLRDVPGLQGRRTPSPARQVPSRAPCRGATPVPPEEGAGRERGARPCCPQARCALPASPHGPRLPPQFAEGRAWLSAEAGSQNPGPRGPWR